MTPTIQADLARFARSMRAHREARNLGREAVTYELTRLGNPVSVSTLLRWEKLGTIKAEDAYYLSRVYDVTIDELLLGSPEPATNGSVSRDSGGATPEDLAGEALASRAVRGAKGAPRSRARRRDPGPG